MKKILFALSLTLLLNYSYSQKKKLFFNTDQEEVTESEFIKQRKNHLIDLELNFENDSTRIKILVKRKNYGQLNDSTFTNLKKGLSPEVQLNNELIVIIYYPGQDACNTRESNTGWNIFNSDYQKKLNKIASNNPFWICKKKDANLKYYYPNKVKWQNDIDKLVENSFFELHYPCFSTVIINKKGEYISYFGEFGKEEVWNLANELTKK